MHLSTLLFPQLFVHITTIFAIPSTAPSLNAASTARLPSTPNATSTSSYRSSIRPPEPPGFQARTWQPESRERRNMLHPLAVYFSVLGYLHQRGQKQGWTHPAELEIYKTPPTQIAISIETIKHADDPPSVPALNIGHVMLALYAGVVSMSENRSFYITRIDVSIFENPIGELWIMGLGDFRLDGTLVEGDRSARLISNGSVKDDGFNAIRDDDVPDAGVYTDNLLPGIELHYDFTPRRVKSEDIFTCLMEAFLILTSQGNVEFTGLDAVSAAPPPRLVLHIHKTNDRRVPTNNVIGDLLWLIAQFYATRKRFDEMEFFMVITAPGYPPSNLAAGFFFRLAGGAGVAPA